MFLNYQIDYLLWLQNLRDLSNDLFTPFFLAVTHFGEFAIVTLFVALIYWSLNKKVGEFLIINLSFGFLLNQIFKMIFCIERPWILSDKIKPVPDAIGHATGYSFPSGHTARATAIWGGLIIQLWDKKITRYVLLALILLIAFSRNYLGVHTPQDVIVSLILSIAVLIISKKAFDKIDSDKKMCFKIFITGIVISLLTILFVVVKPSFIDSDSAISFASQVPSFYKNMGRIMGVILGWYLCREYVNFSTENISIIKRIARYVLGIIIFIPLLLFSKDIFVQDFGLLKGEFFYGTCVSMYLALFYPWIFTKIEKFFDIDKIEVLWKKN